MKLLWRVAPHDETLVIGYPVETERPDDPVAYVEMKAVGSFLASVMCETVNGCNIPPVKQRFPDQDDAKSWCEIEASSLEAACRLGAHQ